MNDEQLNRIWYWIHIESANYGQIRDRFKQVVRAVDAKEDLQKFMESENISSEPGPPGR